MLDPLGYVGFTDDVISTDALPRIELILKQGLSNLTTHQWLTATIPGKLASASLLTRVILSLTIENFNSSRTRSDGRKILQL